MAVCKKCKIEQSENENVRIVGNAVVEGHTTLLNFEDFGIEWTATASSDECWECPKCGHLNKIRG